MTATTLDRPMRLLRHAWFNSPLYGLVLSGKTPNSLLLSLRDAWPGDAARGEELIQDGEPFRAALDRAPGEDGEADPAWLAALHGFAWLRDLRALGGDQARGQARALVAAWLDRNERWSELAWRPDVLGGRLVAWLSNHDLIASGADAAFRERLLTSLTRQARHLARSLRSTPPGVGRLAAIHGLIAVGAALPAGLRWLERGIDQLAVDLPSQFFADGGHRARSPAQHLDALRRLVDMRTIILGTARECSEAHQSAILNAARVLRYLRHRDGGLPLFNDSGEDEGWAVDMVLVQAEPKGEPAEAAPDMGFERLTAGETLVMVDAAPPPAAGFDRHAHAGPQPAWREVQRATAAHSTLSIEDRNSSEILPTGGFGRRPQSVGRMRQQNGEGIWLDIDHDGYQPTFGILHRRRLYLTADGQDLRGEDTLIGDGGNLRFTLRFHLHPKVRASLVEDGGAVLMRLPSGAGWRFRAAGGRLALAESVYLGGGSGGARRSEQIVVEGVIDSACTAVKWAVQAVARGL